MGLRILGGAAPEVGGTDTGPRPLELLLVGLGGCTGMDVISMLRKMRQEVTDYQIEISGELSATRYCSAAAMLGRVAHIDESYRVIDETTGQEQTGTLALAA